ncbi:MAG: ATP-binding protein [Yoonia sp.]|uniref:ATP-binding protein n=1 Tax=Yoonia sp. TaxID=2212373 RepID=UPI003EF4A659
MTSLRRRAIFGGLLWGLVTIVFGLSGLAIYLTNQAQTRFAENLEAHHTQALVAVVNYATTPENIRLALGDPAYRRPFSGQYWQAVAPNGDIYVSRSLADTLLPVADVSDDLPQAREVTGAGNQPLLSIAQNLMLDDGSRWHVQVAASLQTLQTEIAILQRSLIGAFVIITVIAILGALAFIRAVLRPLDALRKEVSVRWAQESGLDPAEYPSEVAPLVADIKSLLERNRSILQNSRRQAADLAHAIKTPSAIMRNALDHLRTEGTDVGEAVDALDRLDAQLMRSFARMRADGTDLVSSAIIGLDHALGRMERAFGALAKRDDRSFHMNLTPGLRIRMDQSDFEEIMGNLLDNAMKWSRAHFELTVAQTDEPAIAIKIEDDGPGIAEEQLGLATRSGQRLDVSKPGTGLGLAIASDLVHAYGGLIHLGRSENYGGLEVLIRLPVPGGPDLQLAEDNAQLLDAPSEQTAQ